MRSMTSQPLQHQTSHCQVDHRFTTLGQIFVIFAHPSVPTDPSDSSLDDPSTRQHGEGGHWRRFDILGVPSPPSWTLDYLQLPPTFVFDPCLECRTAITHISPDHFQSRTVCVRYSENEEGSFLIRNSCRVGGSTQQQTRCINDNMAFTSADFLRPVITVNPPFSVVFTDCESMMAAEGWASRPIISRNFSWK